MTGGSLPSPTTPAPRCATPVICDHCGVWYADYPIGYVCSSCGGLHFVAAGAVGQVRTARPAAPQGGEPGVSATDEGETENGQPQVQGRDAREVTELRAAIAIAIHEAVAPLYFADNSDYAAGLYSVVKALDPALWMQLEDGVTDAHYEHTLAAAEAHRAAVDLAVDRSRSSTKSVAVAEENAFRGAPETAPLRCHCGHFQAIHRDGERACLGGAGYCSCPRFHALAARSADAPGGETAQRKLAAFGAWAIEELVDHPGADLDGGDAQDKAVEFGVLESVRVTESCGDECGCAAYDGFPQDCYRYPEDIQRALASLTVVKDG